MIRPTVGRVVLFWPILNPGERPDAQPWAAIVTYVWSDRMVNLSVFAHNGVQRSCTSVPLLQDGDAAPISGYYCEWMPYQKGQAARTEAAERQLADVGTTGHSSDPIPVKG